MPLAIINRVRARAEKTDWNNHVAERAVLLGKEIPKIVAEALDVQQRPDGKLTPYDIEVWHREGDHSDICGDHLDLEIIIWANDYPERRENLDERQKKISDEIAKMLLGSDIRGFVWVLLAPASFGTF